MKLIQEKYLSRAVPSGKGRTPSFTACRWTGRSAIVRAHALARAESARCQ
ncbi:hypothetical protein, partial [Bacillus inaquosorum]